MFINVANVSAIATELCCEDCVCEILGALEQSLDGKRKPSELMVFEGCMALSGISTVSAGLAELYFHAFSPHAG